MIYDIIVINGKDALSSYHLSSCIWELDICSVENARCQLLHKFSLEIKYDALQVAIPYVSRHNAI